MPAPAQPEEELAALQRALRDAPANAALHERLSALHEASGDLAAALAHYKLFHRFSLQAAAAGSAALTRAELEQRLPELLALARSQGQSLCLLSLSLDGPADAAAQQDLTDLLRGQCRQRDLVAGHGQEARLLLLVDVDLPIARRVCERVRAAWAQQSQLSLSLGLTAWRGAGDDVGKLLARAETALQAASRAGGNCLRAG
ncbi:diguanylate cyclase domain-containing protein [Paucibacter soli]|uniref:diguanylate cyclase domain-containing protein n=1 Tax=Paucibacter soli TaxID=3133433 RepID=UPI0030AA3CB4